VARGQNSITISIDTSSVQRMMTELAENARDAIRPAAQAGAQVIYEEAKRLAGRSAKSHYFYGTSWKSGSESKAGRYKFNPGNLQRSIYQVYSKDNSSQDLATYHVSWNMEKAPYGLFVEYGISPYIKKGTASQQSFIRAAALNKSEEAALAIEGELAKRLGNL
jgi:hypothetical protein